MILEVTDASLESSCALGLALWVGLWSGDCIWVQIYQTECSPQASVLTYCWGTIFQP